MNFNKFNSSIVDYRKIKNFPESLKTVTLIFEGFALTRVNYSFKDYGRLFANVEMKDWKKLYDFVLMIQDKFDEELRLSHRKTDKYQNRINNYFSLDFSGYLEEGELYNRFAMVDVKGEPHELLFYEFQLNKNFTKKNGDRLIQSFLNNYAKEEI